MLVTVDMHAGRKQVLNSKSVQHCECVCVRAQECNVDNERGVRQETSSSDIFVHELAMEFRTDCVVDEVLFLHRKEHIQEA